MAKIKLYNLEGKSVADHELDDGIFNIVTEPALIHQAVVAQQANSRVAIAHTKTKGEVRGGGIKPWKQKGTGRARSGSIRSPLWKGGGVIFGPRNARNFTLKINKKAKNKALCMVLTDKLKNEKIVLLEKLEIAEPKTKLLKSLLAKFPCTEKKNLISMVTNKNNVYTAGQNLKKLSFCAADSMNVVDLLNCEYLILDKAAITKLVETYKK